MNKNPNPIRKNGNRNIFCPLYGDCLDHAAKLHWESWACFDCHHKQMKAAGVEGPFLSGDTTPYYTISSEIYRRVG